MSAAPLLDRLDRVKPTGPSRWLACCPAHPDRSPSLSIRELEDGRVLLHDFGGCGTEEVLAALNLEMADLFPAPLIGRGPARGYPASRSRISAADLLELLAEEATVVAAVAADFLSRRTISPDDWQRLASAVGRIQRVRDSRHAGRRT